MKKKILFLSTLPPPYHGASMSSSMCLNLLINDKNFDVKNVRLNSSVNTADVGKISLNKFYEILPIIKEIKNLIKIFSPELIYFAPAVTGIGLYRDFYLLQIIKYFSKNSRLILHIRGQFKDKDWKNPFTKFIIKQLLKCDKAIVLGPELIANLRDTIPRNKIYILPNALPETLSDREFQKVIEQNERKTNLKLLFISNMEVFKGWRKVLETCKLLAHLDIDFTCNFIGGWPSNREKRDFYKYIESNNLQEYINHHGQLLNQEKVKFLVESHIMIFPTFYDACPRVVIEAMEFGLPIISSSVGTIPSLIDHNKTGFIVKENNANEILKFVLKLRNSDLRKEMGINSRERFKAKFTLDKYRANFLNIFYEN